MERKRQFEKSVFELLGGLEGTRALANTFYDTMDSMPEAKKIRDMHPKDLDRTCENFSYFLCGWLGGPPLYKEKFGSPNLTGLHAFFNIGEEERDVWLKCMEKALSQQDIDEEVKQHLIERFKIPAEKILQWCQQQSIQQLQPLKTL